MSINLNSEIPRLNEAGLIVQGGIASLVVNAIVHPMCTIKTRLQIARPKASPLHSARLDALRKILAPTGLYNGYCAIALTDMATFSVAYLSNGNLKDRYSPLWSSILTGAISSPFAAIGEGLMANRQVNHMRYQQIFLRAFRPGGLVLSAIREIPFSIAVFYATPRLEEYTRRVLANKKENAGISIVSGIAVGAIAGFLTNPIDLIKTRVQTADPPISILYALRSVTREGSAERSAPLEERGVKNLLCIRNFFNGGLARGMYIGGAVGAMNLVNHSLPNLMPRLFLKE